MEPITEEKPQSALEPFPDHDAIPNFQIVDQSPNPEAEKEKSKTKPKKKLRFQRIRGSVASEISDGNHSLWIEPEKPVLRPQKWRMGMLEDRAIGGVPGSMTLFDDDIKYRNSLGVSPSAFSSHLPTFHSRSGHATPKTPRSPVRKRARDGKTVLEPPPDDSHNDPLNWKGWRRCLALLSLAILSTCGGAMATVLANGFGERFLDFNTTSTKLGLTNGMFMIGLAVGSIFMTPLAVIYGKRVIYLFCTWLFLVTSIACAFARIYEGFIIARLFMGVAVSPIFTLAPSTVAELFHIHQRGTVIGVYYFFMLAGMTAGPIASAAIISSNLDWSWIFWVTSVAAGLALVLIVLLVPESYWDRTLRPVHSRSCFKARSRANSGRSARSYFSHCTCPVYTPPDPHPGKLVTFERLSPAAMEQRAQAHREAAMQRYYENSADTPMAADAIVSPPPQPSTTYNTAKSSPEPMTVISPRPFEDPRAAPSPPSRPSSAYISSSLNAHSSSSNPPRTTAQMDFATSPTTISPPSLLKAIRARSDTASTTSTLVPSRSRSTSAATRPTFYNPYRPPASSPPRRTRSPTPTPGPSDRPDRPVSISSASSLSSSYSRASSPPSPLSRSPSPSQNSSSGVSFTSTTDLANQAPSTRPFSQPYSTTTPGPAPSSRPSSSSTLNASLPPTISTGWDDSRPSLRLDLEQILLDRASVGAFTDHTGRSGYQNGEYGGSYFRTFHSSSIAGLTTPGRSGHPGMYGGGMEGKGAEYTEKMRILPRQGWVKGIKVGTGRLSDDSYLRIVGRPVGMLRVAPGLVWAGVLFAWSLGTVVVMARALAVVLVGNMGVDGEGYGLSTTRGAGMGLATLIGVAVGTVGVGVLGDVMVRLMSIANRGVYEPEFRFVGMVVGIMAAGAGIMGFGWMVEEELGLEIVGVFLGLIGLGCAIGVTTAVRYVVDVVGGAVAEGMVVLTVIFALCHGLVFSLVFDEWIVSRGPKEVFLVMGAVEVAIMAGAIPMYVFGKRIRAWGARKTLFEQM
ncbi:MFS-type transporter-like protein 63 [Elsinoe fawcettii]|nr:MFS-type transporter-like protein 63 [Elsinoe fawcettii]